MNIIQKLNTSSDSKREKYMRQVRKEFNLVKEEKWVITKLRMMIVRLDVNMELLQIRKSINSKVGVKLSPKEKLQRKALKEMEHKCKVFVEEDYMTNGLPDLSWKQSVLVKLPATKQKKTNRKQRKTLKARQLEKLRNIDYVQDDQGSNTLVDKVSFLKSLNLQRDFIYI